VTGTGLDRVYPAQNRDLTHEIAREGLLVSEYPLGTPPLPANFPRRNRILAALSLGTLVVEAALKSGSLITARLAAENGREVFAIPGSIHNPLSRGCHALIRDGAKLVETAEHVLEELAPLLGEQAPALQATPAPRAQRPTPAIDTQHQQVLDALGFDPATTDELVERTGFPAAEISSILLLLELQGHVSSAPGGLFTRLGNRPE
jgi:DNA processing protein